MNTTTLHRQGHQSSDPGVVYWANHPNQLSGQLKLWQPWDEGAEKEEISLPATVMRTVASILLLLFNQYPLAHQTPFFLFGNKWYSSFF